MPLHYPREVFGYVQAYLLRRAFYPGLHTWIRPGTEALVWWEDRRSQNGLWCYSVNGYGAEIIISFNIYYGTI